jgi:endonuclease/exonuclease/phosphatase family metal-dependent hydrolase
MDDKRKWYARPWFIVVVVILLVSMAGLFARLGGIEVAVNEAAYVRPPAGPVEFTACTYNVQGRPWFDDTKHKFTSISPLLNRFDIVGVQECFKDHARLWAQADHPVKIYHSQLKHVRKIVGSGLGILGRYPLVSTEAINFDALGEFQNWPASKGVLMARFDMGGMMLDVYTTHIEAGKSPEALQAKVGQGEEMVAMVRKHSPPEHSVIFMGDFNMRPSRGPEDKEKNKDNPRVYVFDNFRDALGLRDAADEINGPVGEEIDRILFRAGTGHTMTALSWQHDDPAFYDAAKVPLSDHEPVFVKFRIAPKAGA